MQRHCDEVSKISASVKSFYDHGERFRINHGSTNSTRKGALGRDPRMTVDTSRLNLVIHVDTEAQTALVEPNVPMDQLVTETLKFGLIPPVVMEFPGITVGGGYNGTSGESSSFKHGFFNQTLNSLEIVLANGEIITCSEQNYPDLFHGAAGAVGTLGVTTMVEIQLRPAQKFVETTYHPVTSLDEAIEKVKSFSDRTGKLDYVDGIMYSQKQGAIITGRMTNAIPDNIPIRRFSDAKDPWFYMHVQNQISNRTEPISEVIPLPEYLFRYDRGGFWVGAEPFRYFAGVPFNKFTRRWLDDFLHTRMLYKALHGSGQSDRMIIQDLALPYNTAKDFIEFTDSKLGIWPLWLCPLRQSQLPTMHPHLNEYEADGKTLKPMLNIGLWGEAPRTLDRFVAANKEIERKLHELNGMKWLYAQTYYSESDFWAQFDREWYDALRKKFHATSLPSVYEKVRTDAEAGAAALPWHQRLLQVWPFAGLNGIRKAVQSGDYLLARKATWKDWVPRG